MSLFINQGIQDTSKDAQEPIIAQNVQLIITKVTLNEKLVNTIDVTFKVFGGVYNGKVLKDSVQYLYDSKCMYDNTWKYRALRRAAGCQYNEKEGQQVDIETLLLNKVVLADLSIQSKDDKKYQKFAYKAMKKVDAPVQPAMQQQAQQVVQEQVPSVTPEDVDRMNKADAFFGDAPEQQSEQPKDDWSNWDN